MEYEMSMRQTVEADVTRLRKLLDDTNVTRMHLEGDIESLKEELIMLKKNHLAVRRFLCWRKPPLGPVQLRAQPKKTGVLLSTPLIVSPLNRTSPSCAPRSAPWVSTWTSMLPKAMTWPRSWRRCGRSTRG